MVWARGGGGQPFANSDVLCHLCNRDDWPRHQHITHPEHASCCWDFAVRRQQQPLWCVIELGFSDDRLVDSIDCDWVLAFDDYALHINEASLLVKSFVRRGRKSGKAKASWYKRRYECESDRGHSWRPECAKTSRQKADERNGVGEGGLVGSHTEGHGANLSENWSAICKRHVGAGSMRLYGGAIRIQKHISIIFAPLISSRPLEGRSDGQLSGWTDQVVRNPLSYLLLIPLPLSVFDRTENLLEWWYFERLAFKGYINPWHTLPLVS